MMDSETWMTATEAHELKFCDEVEEKLAVTAMAMKGRTIFRNGFGFSRIDENLSAKLPKNAVLALEKHEKEEAQSEMEIKNAAELEKAYPEFSVEIKNAAEEAGYIRGVQAERERLKALDSLNAPGREGIIARAKYDDPKDARDIAIELLQATNAQAHLAALQHDAEAVNAALPPAKDTQQDQAEREAAINAVANELNRLRGFK